MDHPGPPQFVAVGDTVQLAPRDPDPDMTYQWSILDLPEESNQRISSDEPVIDFVPDTAGRYRIGLATSDEEYSLTIRAFPSEYAPSNDQGGASGRSGVSARPGASGGRSGAQPHRSGSGSVGAAPQGTAGRPRLQLSGTVEETELVVHADTDIPGEAESNSDDITVEFILDDRDNVDSTDISQSSQTLRIPISAVGEKVRVHAVALSDTYSVPDTIAFSGETISESMDQ
ncbi:MAG: hypothetical protein J07HQX50_00033 [Haloquadratum sp. J07HQX50]|jgi:hypothetical protein|nr:MAG: hypothetical protein J07HQX50_00033 [Haloquadratum sp. J07HQX50]